MVSTFTRYMRCQGQGSQHSLPFVGGVRKSLSPRFIEEPRPVSHRHPQWCLQSKRGKEEFCDGFVESPVTAVRSFVSLLWKGSVLPTQQELPLLVAVLWAPAGKPQI